MDSEKQSETAEAAPSKSIWSQDYIEDTKEVKLLEGWRKYVGAGTIVFSLFALLTASGGAIVATIIFALGAGLFMPFLMRAPLPNGQEMTIGPRIFIWVIIFSGGLFFMPNQPSEAPEALAKVENQNGLEPSAMPSEVQTTLEPTATPKPKATPTPPAGMSLEKVLANFQTNISEAGLSQYVVDIAMHKHIDNEVVVTVSNAILYEPKEIQLQFAKTLWSKWATECVGMAEIKDIDSCRIKVVDIANTKIAESSLWGGSIVKLK